VGGSGGSGGAGGSGGSGGSEGSGGIDLGVSDDLANLLLGKKVDKVDEVIEGGKCSLQDMYDEAFPTVGEVPDREWEDFLKKINMNEGGISRFLLSFYRVSELLIGKGGVDDSIREYLEKIKEILRSQKEIVITQEMKKLLRLDYSYSVLGWEAYKKDVISKFQEKRTRIVFNKCLLEAYQKGFKEKSIVDADKKKRLVKGISMAIEIGLNYQELAKFKVKHVPNGELMTELMTEEDLNDLGVELEDPVMEEGKTYFLGDKLITTSLRKLGLTKVTSFDDAKLKKVLVADVNNHPYWEKMGAGRRSDLSEYISLWKLKNMSYPQYINPTKRETLTKIYETFGSYDINLDEATPVQLGKMCRLDTLKLAPGVHKAVCEDGNIEEAFREWQKSNRSYKLLQDDVEIKSKPYIALPVIEAPQDFNPDIIGQVLGEDFTNLARVIKLHNRDNHEAESEADPLVLSDAPSDMDFAKKLSDAFVELGFLPEGYERYCGVKVGEVRAKRSSDGTASPAKRPKTKLFTPIEIQ